jgi:hypothetical protein
MLDIKIPRMNSESLMANSYWPPLKTPVPHLGLGQNIPPTSPSKAVAKPTASTPKAKRLQEIWVAETKKDALAAFDAFVES